MMFSLLLSRLKVLQHTNVNYKKKEEEEKEEKALVFNDGSSTDSLGGHEKPLLRWTCFLSQSLHGFKSIFFTSLSFASSAPTRRNSPTVWGCGEA